MNYIFLCCGYKKYQSDTLHETAECLYQKRIYNKSNKLKYIINVYEYNMKKHIPNYPKEGLSYQVELQFYRNNKTFDISFDTFENIGDLEQTCEEIWTKLRMDYDHHND